MKPLLVFMVIAVTTGLRAGRRRRRPPVMIVLAAAGITVTLLYSARWL